MPRREGVAEVEDGEDEADELAQRHHQRDGEGGALRGEDEDASDADVSGWAEVKGTPGLRLDRALSLLPAGRWTR